MPYCTRCGTWVEPQFTYCPKCGLRVDGAQNPVIRGNGNAVVQINGDVNQPVVVSTGGMMGRRKNKWVAFFLCLFGGYAGIHKFYEDKTLMGFVYLFTFGLMGIGWIMDCISLLFKPNPYYVR